MEKVRRSLETAFKNDFSSSVSVIRQVRAMGSGAEKYYMNELMYLQERLCNFNYFFQDHKRKPGFQAIFYRDCAR